MHLYLLLLVLPHTYENVYKLDKYIVVCFVFKFEFVYRRRLRVVVYMH